MIDEILPHHQAAIQRLSEHFQADPRYLALIIGGSVAKRRALPDSDLDLMLIVTDAFYNERRANGTDHFKTSNLADLGLDPAGTLEGKLLNWQFLLNAAERGSEPTRFSFVEAVVAYSHLPELEAQMQAITAYPTQEQPAKILSFGGQVANWSGYVSAAAKRQDAFASAYAAANLVLFAGRLILVHNQRLYPGPKWFMTELGRAPQKPAGFMEQLQALLAAPTGPNSDAIVASILQFRDWGVTIPQVIGAYIEDSERRWRHDRPDLADW